MMDKLTQLLARNGIDDQMLRAATIEELENTMIELAAHQADLEDALVELAGLLGGE